jgi:CPA2 family monovalent cation:H+ antiporter-2
MHEVTFLQDLAIVMIVAGLVTVLFHRLKQPVVLGYIVAGIIIGPHTPPFPLIADEETIRTLSELGVILLMFSLGLEFSLRKLREVGATALIAALSAIVLMVWAGYGLGRAFGWNTMDSVFLGAILSISSTTIIVKALEDLGKRKEKFATLILGILIVEDILAIVMIALLSGFAATGSFSAADVGITIIKLGSFLITLLVAGLIIVPLLLNYVAKFKSNEMLLVSVLGLCFGVSLLAAKLNYSVALGAFLIGAIIAESRQIVRIEMLMEPVRDMFSAVFFVSIGLLIDPALIWQYAVPIIVITVTVVLGQSITCSLGTFIAGHDRRTSLRVGMGLAQIGEFSFIIASLGLTLNVTSRFLYPIAVAVSGLTTLISPYLIKHSDQLVDWFDRSAPSPLKNYLDLYTRWIGSLGKRGRTNFAFGLVRKWTWQIGLNVILISAIFITAAFFRQRVVSWHVPGGENGAKALLWLGAMLLSLPILIATVRKMRALAMLLSELSVTRAAAGEQTRLLRAVVANTILALACAALALVILLLSSTILPSWNVFLVVVLILIAGGILLARSSIRIYARAQFALKETLSQPPPSRDSAPERVLPALLQEAALRRIHLIANSPAAGKLLGELQLRTKTGASVVGIERNGATIINPGPDEELRADDEVLLLGSPKQLEAAFQFLGGGQKTSAVRA